MNKLAPGIVAGTATLALGLTALSPAVASPASDSKRDVRDSASAKHRPDNRTSPQIRKQARLKAKARVMVENGSARAKTLRDGSQVVELADGEFVELGETGTDRIWTILSEFGTEGSKKLGLTPGPQHNEIPSPSAPRTTPRRGRPTTARPTTTTCSTVPASR